MARGRSGYPRTSRGGRPVPPLAMLVLWNSTSAHQSATLLAMAGHPVFDDLPFSDSTARFTGPIFAPGTCPSTSVGTPALVSLSSCVRLQGVGSGRRDLDSDPEDYRALSPAGSEPCTPLPLRFALARSDPRSAARVRKGQFRAKAVMVLGLSLGTTAVWPGGVASAGGLVARGAPTAGGDRRRGRTSRSRP